MKIQSILFPTDFSHYNDAALKLASTLAAEARATLHIVHVHEVRELNAALGDASFVWVASWESEIEAVRRHLQTIVPAVPAVWYEHSCLTGSPVEEIVKFAGEKKIDLIVMASHGRTGLSRLMMGSVAEGVMRKAPCPVLIVKQPAGMDEESGGNPESSEKVRLAV